MAATQVIEDDHLVPCLQQFPGNHAADITRSPGNQNPHWLLALSSQVACPATSSSPFLGRPANPIGSGADVNLRLAAARLHSLRPTSASTQSALSELPLPSIVAIF